jgi:hypothetical protein
LGDCDGSKDRHPAAAWREFFVRTAPSQAPDLRLYRGLRYQPAAPGELTRKQRGVVRDFVRAAKGRGLRVYFQIQAAIPPGYRVQSGGLRVDWPEYPPYLLDDVFLDFRRHAEAAAARLGYPSATMKKQAQELYEMLHEGRLLSQELT